MTGQIPRHLIITIDGPSGSGKSTVAKMIARVLNYTYIDTGAMYRGVACAFARKYPEVRGQRSEVSEERVQKTEGLKKLLANLDLRFEFGVETRVYLDGEDISVEIREPAVSMLASKLSQNGLVREYLCTIQRAQGKDGGIILEGRDIGSVVFPDAHVKFYLDANPEERARRRYLELSSKGAATDITTVKNDMVKRDKNDSERELAPLIIPEGAINIDTSGHDVEVVVALLLKHITIAGAKWKQ